MGIVTPFVTVDIIIRYEGGIVLVKRKNPPHGWALPGGFIEIGESLEESARREAKEETSLDVVLREQFHAYSDPRRDPRFHTVTIVFIADGKGLLKARDDAKEAAVFFEGRLPEPIVFDHETIISQYSEYTRTGKRPTLDRP